MFQSKFKKYIIVKILILRQNIQIFLYFYFYYDLFLQHFIIIIIFKCLFFILHVYWHRKKYLFLNKQTEMSNDFEISSVQHNFQDYEFEYMYAIYRGTSITRIGWGAKIKFDLQRFKLSRFYHIKLCIYEQYTLYYTINGYHIKTLY